MGGRHAQRLVDADPVVPDRLSAVACERRILGNRFSPSCGQSLGSGVPAHPSQHYRRLVLPVLCQFFHVLAGRQLHNLDGV